MHHIIRRGRLWSAMFCMCAVTTTACQPSGKATHSQAGASNSAGRVTIVRVTPDTVTVRPGAISEIAVHGSGFDADDNTVVLGPITLGNVKSTSNGTLITLMVPDRVPSGGGASPMLWVPGVYELTVANQRGRSAAVSVTVQEFR